MDIKVIYEDDQRPPENKDGDWVMLLGLLIPMFIAMAIATATHPLVFPIIAVPLCWLGIKMGTDLDDKHGTRWK